MSQKLLSIDIRTLFSFWQSRKVPSEVPRCTEHVLLRWKVCCEKQNGYRPFCTVRPCPALCGVALPTGVLDGPNALSGLTAALCLSVTG